MIGQTLAHYRILEKIGSGGMGDVYLAEDTKLDRKVALKVLPPELAESEERRTRFRREAKAIAALDHPNIVQVFSVEEAQGVHFITMQLVQGKTLTELLPKNGFPLSKFFEIAIPLTDAVAAAHQEGITHRDLKPDNMMVGDDGRVKVLDFGLAKPAGGFGVESEGPTAAKTGEGVIVGTVDYMSPEQAEGKQVDHRTDIFSIGIILYELATGQRPFRGDTAGSILSSIIKDTPASVSEFNPSVPSELSKIVRRCLVKDAEHRYQSAKDVRNELEELKEEVDSGTLTSPVSPSARTPRIRPVGVAVVLALVSMAGVLWYLFRPSQPVVPRLTNPVQVTSAVGVEDHPAWSPDGATLAYISNQSGNWDIWLTKVGGGLSLNRTANNNSRDRWPTWSPDGRSIAFVAFAEGGPGIFEMPALTGAPRLVVSSGSNSAPHFLTGGGEIAFSTSRNVAGEKFLEIASLGSDERRKILLLGEQIGRFDLSWSGDEQLVAYVDALGGSDEVSRIMIVRLADGEAFRVTSGLTSAWSPTFSANGRNLFFVSNRVGSMDLWMQPLSEDGRPSGDPWRVTTGIGMQRAAFSPDGSKLAYSRGGMMANVWRVPLLSDRTATWTDAEQLTFDEALIEFVDVSRDGQKLLVSSNRAGNQDVWMVSVGKSDWLQLTTDPAPDWCPRWSPDGQDIAFYSYRSGNREIWTIPASGGLARPVTQGALDARFPSWSPDGQYIAYWSGRGGNRDIWVVPSEGGDPRQVTDDSGQDTAPSWSPDGQWIVFASYQAEGGARLWRVPSSGGDPERLSKSSGTRHAWTPDGRHIFYWVKPEFLAITMEAGTERVVADLSGRPGDFSETLATDGTYLYFAWQEDLGDIWVMDVVTDEDE